VGNDSLTESLKVLEELGYTGRCEQNVIHVEVDPARPLPQGLVLR
jgi:hypothetical protein